MKLKLYSIKKKFIKHIPEILTGTAVAGVIASDVLFVRAAKKESKDGDKKHYILPAITSGVTIGTIIASNRVSNSQKASLAAAGALTASKYVEYRKNVQECLPEELCESLDDLEKQADEANEVDGECEEIALFYLPQFGIMFESTFSQVSTALLNLNQSFVHEGEASLGDFLRFLPRYKDAGMLIIGDEIGWRINYDDPDNGTQYITTRQYQKRLKNGRICNYIYFNEEPMDWDYWLKRYDDAKF